METKAGRTALVVEGLSLSMTSDDLKEVFMPFGTVVWASVVRDRKQHSLAYGYVVMGTDEEAAKAIGGLHAKQTGDQKLLVDHTTIQLLRRTA